jgi:hypothetical protein
MVTMSEISEGSHRFKSEIVSDTTLFLEDGVEETGHISRDGVSPEMMPMPGTVDFCEFLMEGAV